MFFRSPFTRLYRSIYIYIFSTCSDVLPALHLLFYRFILFADLQRNHGFILKLPRLIPLFFPIVFHSLFVQSILDLFSPRNSSFRAFVSFPISISYRESRSRVNREWKFKMFAAVSCETRIITTNNSNNKYSNLEMKNKTKSWALSEIAMVIVTEKFMSNFIKFSFVKA